MADTVRGGLLARTCLEVLADAERPLPAAEVITQVGQRIDQFTPYELDRITSGDVRWKNDLNWSTANMTTIGWMTKTGGWQITDLGREALEQYPDPDELLRTANRLHNQAQQERKRAVERLGPLAQDLALALGEVSAGEWTAYEDLAAITGTDPATVMNFLAKEKVPHAIRVLPADGSHPAEGMLHSSLRGWDIRAKLAEQGVEFDASGQADPTQRVTAEELRERLTGRDDDEPRPRRAWLVRGVVDGYQLVPEWSDRGFVSLAASRLPRTAATADPEELEAVVRREYEHKSYAQQDRLVREFTAFLWHMRTDDYVATVDQGRLLLGVVTGEPEFTDSPGARTNLRRSVRWLNPDSPVDYSRLGEQFVTKLGDQSQVVNLTEVLDAIQALAEQTAAHQPVQVPQPEAKFAPVTDQLADELLVHDRGWLDEVADLLADKRQLILAGPPGTGKTYLATRLARHLTGDEHAVTLVQFHPSYTYEDFFEGFRPRVDRTGQLSFELRPGPLRRLADQAREDPHTPYVLIIDEINRANLAKVFGELYFLLEYREESIALQYSPDELFTLPRNLYLIGTMNTADRSIALVDAAMRRRFAFVEMHPDHEPVRGLLRRWLARHGYVEEAAGLLDALNERLADREHAIGPSYLMHPAVYSRPNGLERVWATEILPLLADLHHGEGVDVADEFGLATLRRQASPPPEPPAVPAQERAELA